MGTSVNGIGTGLDIDSIVSSLVTAQKTPKQSQITEQKTAATTKLSAIGSLSSALDTFQTALKNLNSTSTSTSTSTSNSNFAPLKVSSNDEKIATASLGANATAGTYEIKVTNLATSSKVATAYVASSSTFGSGSLTISQAGTSYNIDVASGSSLSAVRDNINNNSSLKSAGITANIITDSSGQRLVLSSTKTGAGTDIGVTSTDASTGDGQSSLSSLNISTTLKASSSQGGYVSALAVDASYTIDGLSMTSSTNKVSNAITGVDFTLVKADTATITVAPNKDGLTTSINSFVSAYNALVNTITSLTSVSSTTDSDGNSTSSAAALTSDSTTREILNKLRDQLVGSSTNGGAISMLSQLGVTTNKDDGTLSVDSTKLSDALTNNFSSVQGFFTGSGGLLTRMSSSLDNYTKTNGLLDQRTASLNDTLSDLADQQTKLDSRIAKYETIMYNKYNSMNTLVNQLTATRSSVLTTLNALNNSSSDDS
ncbi:flagellar cap protein FliD [Pseudomonas sp. LTJR-52]|uniref:flagellar filament capping protein FliD n=1 Tax=Pseudomonas sp. LTJR-52 TaxID=2479392 RepID=UPI000EFB0572|nr:flagellar filament capping protein FliD [Pseudomonas sp. LTJR-52]AYN94973.1 flagellar cap protein FliD [Pseudomonas sp. LTJR-52]